MPNVRDPDPWGPPVTQPAAPEADASTVMEAGLILPQPGEEAAWFERNRAQLSALAPDGVKGL